MAEGNTRKEVLRSIKAANFAENHGTNRKADARYDKRQVDYQKSIVTRPTCASGYHKPGSRKKVY